MSLGIIYKAENKVNGKVYVGQTIEPINIRIKKHKCNRRNYPFTNAIRKYGSSGFSWFILEECCSKYEMDLAEEWYIRYYKSNEIGYNITLGGEGVHGHKHSIATRKKMSKAAKGRKSNMLGKKHSLETRNKMSESAKIRKMKPFSDEHRKNMSLAKIGKKISDETKKKISDSLSRYYDELKDKNIPMWEEQI